jgi:hypothetical protein
MDLRCYHCGDPLRYLSLPLGRLDQCRNCGRYLHACRMCAFYDPTETSKQCTEDDSEKVHDKVNSNFCDYFKPNEAAFSSSGRNVELEARAELDALFGDSSKEAAQGNASDALKDAEALFDD